MRPLNFILYNGCSNMSLPTIPAARRLDARRSARRRIEDQIESLCSRACNVNDLEVASDLLALLDRWSRRRMTKVGHDQRIDGPALKRARNRLEALTRARKLKT